DSSEVGDQSSAGPLVQSLPIAGLSNLERSRNVDDEESGCGFHLGSHLGPRGSEWRDRCADRNAARFGHARSNPCLPEKIRVAILRTEPQFRGQLVANMIAIQ